MSPYGKSCSAIALIKSWSVLQVLCDILYSETGDDLNVNGRVLSKRLCVPPSSQGCPLPGVIFRRWLCDIVIR